MVLKHTVDTGLIVVIKLENVSSAAFLDRDIIKAV